MKKFLSAILAILMLLTVCGCGSSDNTTDADKAPEFTIGEWNGNVYTNEFAGLTFNMPGGWTYASEEELVELMGLALDITVEDNEVLQKIAELSNSYALYASNATETNNVQILFENLAVTGNKEMTAEQYLDVVCSQLESTYSSMGFTCTLGDRETLKLGSSEYIMVDITAEYSGISVQQTYAVRKVDKYMASIVFSAESAESIDAMIACFE